MILLSPHRLGSVLIGFALLTATGSLNFTAEAAPAKTPAQAVSDNPIEIKLNAFKVVKVDGKDELRDAGQIKPGEILEYQARYTNKGERAVRNLAATLPIPNALEFLPGTAEPEGAQVSTDGKTFAAPPLKRITKSSDGSTRVEIVSASEYRFLRWNVGDLGAGKSVLVSARARVHGTVKSSAKSSATAGSSAGTPAAKGGGR